MNTVQTHERGLLSPAVVGLCAACAVIALGVAILGPRLLERRDRRPFAVVDLTAVVRKQQQVSVALLADSADPRVRTTAMLANQEFGGRLDRVLSDLSKECRCILLMREAVIAGQLDDLTPLLLSRLTDKK